MPYNFHTARSGLGRSSLKGITVGLVVGSGCSGRGSPRRRSLPAAWGPAWVVPSSPPARRRRRASPRLLPRRPACCRRRPRCRRRRVAASVEAVRARRLLPAAHRLVQELPPRLPRSTRNGTPRRRTVPARARLLQRPAGRAVRQRCRARTCGSGSSRRSTSTRARRSTSRPTSSTTWCSARRRRTRRRRRVRRRREPAAARRVRRHARRRRSRGVNSDRDAITIKRAWAEVAVPLGILKFGRQPNHWGMGMNHNSGGRDPIAGTYDSTATTATPSIASASRR